MKRRSFDESDLIRLRLQRLDQLTALPSFKQLFTTAPMLGAAVSFIAGIWFVEVIHSQASFWPAFGLSGLISAIALFIAFRFTGRGKLIALMMAAYAAFFAAGLARYYRDLYIGPDHISRCFEGDRQLATIKGHVISPVSNVPNDPAIPWLQPQGSFYMRAEAVQSVGKWVPVTGNLRVQVDEPVDHVRAGNEVLVYCWLSRFQPAPNPGQFDIQKYMARKGIYAAASVGVKEGIEVLDDSIAWIAYLRSVVSRFCDESLLDDSLPDRDVRNMSAALLLGRRENLDPAVMAAFQKTNLAHYISLSGQNVGILAGSLWILLRTFGLPKRPRAGLCILLIVLYALAVPSMPAINRAVFLACFIFASFLFKRKSKPINTLCLSAIILLLFRPSELFSVGWQLSFLSVLGILVFYEPAVFYLRAFLFFPVVLLFNGRWIFVQSIWRAVLDLLAVGVAAWIAIAGLLFYYFGSINPLSPLWTVLVFPFVLGLLYAGYLKLIIAKLLPTAAALLSVIINYSARWFEESVVFFSQIDLTRLTSNRPPCIAVLAIYIVLLALFFVPFFYRRMRTVLCFTCGLLFLYPFLCQHVEFISQNDVEFTCLSVGHGQAIVLSAPDGEYVLFDAGSMTIRNAAQKAVLPFLQKKGISTLNAVYISHGDLDHINALNDIAASVRIKKMYANARFLNAANNPSLEQDTRNGLKRYSIDAESMRQYRTDGLLIRSLWPTQPALDASGLSDNDKSEILLAEYANRRILLCGDVELYAQQTLASMYPQLRVDVLVLPHHGSNTNLDEHFIKQLNPRIVIASCAASRMKNVWQPSGSDAVSAFYTGRDGAVTIKIKADGTIHAAGFIKSDK
ncbi:MAG: DNA internalization-related competence protein ComEC/Rec2 [Planctomycetaceae bacterium]|nr:DNA internalization-related competence protein ComEC/Rec2 [Planctomycetaceae bacterium]